MKEIRVTGKGKLTVIPDRTIVIVGLSGVEEDYKKAIEKSKELSQDIKDIFTELGFDDKDIKTRNFGVESKYERDYDKRNNWELIFKGYEFEHELKIEFDKNSEILGRILFRLSRSKAKPELKIQYTVKDVEKQKNELLKQAVYDSKKKAEILADASNVKLGEIKTIDYSWGEVKVVSNIMDKFIDCMALNDDTDDFEDEAIDMDLEPEDINLSDTVTIVWNIE